MNVFARKRADVAVTKPANLSIGDPQFMARYGYGDSLAGVEVNQYTALGISAMWRGSMQIASSIAGLPLPTLRQWGSTTSRITSWLDDPGIAVGFNPFNWKQTSMLHMILGGDSFQRHLYNGVNTISGLEPINPNCVSVYWDAERPGGKRYEISVIRDGRTVRETHDRTTMTQVMGPTLDGLRGLSVVGMARTSLGGAIAADVAAANSFRRGPMIGGIAVPTDAATLAEGDAERIQMQIDDQMGGTENAGRIVVVERGYDLKPWGMTLKDAQFLESRQFSIQEIARWLGVHPVFLMDPGAVSTWGTGVEILQRGLGRFTLPAWTDPFQEAMSDLLPKQTWAEFDFKGLERGSPSDEIALIVQQIDGGLLTINQALSMVNRPGIGPAGDVLRLHGIPLNPEVAATPAPTGAELRALLTGDGR